MVLSVDSVREYILTKLPEHICGDETPEDIAMILDYIFAEEEVSLTVSSGADKAAAIFEDVDFVVKCATVGQDSELINYRDAKDSGLDKFFARTFDGFAVSGLYCYFQEKMDLYMLGRRIDTIELSYEEEILARSLSQASRELVDDYNFFSRLAASTPNQAKDLIEFLVSHDINDIHGSNYIFNGENVVIFDYSGYHREYSEEEESYWSEEEEEEEED